MRAVAVGGTVRLYAREPIPAGALVGAVRVVRLKAYEARLAFKCPSALRIDHSRAGDREPAA